MKPIHSTLALAALLALGGCGAGSDDAADDTTEITLEEPADEGLDGGGDFDGGHSETSGESDEGGPVLTAAAIEGIERGLVRENEGLQAALDELGKADTDAGKLLALGRIDLEAIEAEGAAAAGLSAEHYATLKEDVFDALGKLEMRDMLEAQYSGIDAATLDEDTRAQLEQNRQEVMAGVEDPFEGMDQAAADAFTARQARLAELRAQHIGLLFKFLGG